MVVVNWLRAGWWSRSTAGNCTRTHVWIECRCRPVTNHHVDERYTVVACYRPIDSDGVALYQVLGLSQALLSLAAMLPLQLPSLWGLGDSFYNIIKIFTIQSNRITTSIIFGQYRRDKLTIFFLPINRQRKKNLRFSGLKWYRFNFCQMPCKQLWVMSFFFLNSYSKHSRNIVGEVIFVLYKSIIYK